MFRGLALAARGVVVMVGTAAGLAPWLLVIGGVLAFVIFAGQRYGFFGESVSLPPGSAAVAEGDERSVSIYTLLPRDSIRSIDDPKFVSAAAAEADMNPNEFVIGVTIDGDARAYPLNVLSVHEVVNDTVGGRPVSITY